jgi:hypothetical protein
LPRHSIFLAVTIAAALLTACAHHTVPLANSGVVHVPGRATAGLHQREATERALVLAAKITVDHGFRYFRIVGGRDAFALQPGTGFSIKLTAEDDGSAGLLDAEDILIKGTRSGMR